MARRFCLAFVVPLVLGLVACGGSSTPAPTAGVPTVAATVAATAPTATAARPAATAAVATASPSATARSTASPATAVRATATRTVAAATATRTASVATATRAGASPAAATTGVSGVGTETTGTCQVGIPVGFAAVGGQDGAWTDRTALLVLTPVPTNGQDFAAWTQTVGDLVTSSAPQGTTVRPVEQRSDRYRAEFTSPADPTNLLIPYAASGTFVAVPATAGQVCAAELIFPQGQEAKYAPLAEGVVASLRPRQP